MEIQKIREMKKQVARFIRIGELAQKAGIDTLEPEILLGGFLEIAHNKHQYNAFFKKGADRLKNEHTLTFIKLNQKPDVTVLSNLRSLKFFFDPFNFCLFGPFSNKYKAQRFLNSNSN